MKISNGYFRHPSTGELIAPGELYTLGSLAVTKKPEPGKAKEMDEINLNQNKLVHNNVSKPINEAITEPVHKQIYEPIDEPKSSPLKEPAFFEELEKLTIAELKVKATELGVDTKGIKKSELLNAVKLLLIGEDTSNG